MYKSSYRWLGVVQIVPRNFSFFETTHTNGGVPFTNKNFEGVAKNYGGGPTAIPARSKCDIVQYWPQNGQIWPKWLK